MLIKKVSEPTDDANFEFVSAMMLVLFQVVGVFSVSFYTIHSTALLFAPKLSHHLKDAGHSVCLNRAASLRNGKLDNRTVLLLSREEEFNNFEASTAAGIRTILKCPNVYAVKDIILLLTNVTVTQDRPFIVAAALRRVVELSGKYTGDPTSAKMAFSNTQIVELMSDLVVNFPSSSSSSSSLEAYFCVNVLYSIARMKKRSENNSFIFHHSVRTFIPNISHPTAQLLSLQYPSWTRQVATKSVVEILWSLAVLHPHSTPILLQSIAIRLQSSDALGKLSSTEICTVLWAFSQLGSNADNTKHCMVALSKRLRKQTIREATTSWDILKAISAVVKYKKMLQKNHYMNKSQEDSKDETHVYCEFQRLCYLLIRTLCERKNTISNNSMCLSALDNTQVLQLLGCMESLHVEVEPHIYHTLLSSIPLEDYPMFTWNQAIVLLKFQAKYNLPRSGVSELTKQLHVAILYLGNRTTTNASTTTTTLCEIIRSISTIIPYYPNETQQPLSNVLNQAMHLLMIQPESSFCEYSLSILLDSLARCQYTNDEHLYTLGCRVLQPDIVQHCSAKSASKIVWSFAVLLGNTTTSQDPILSFTNEKLRRQQVDILEKFGVALLSSSRLSATDTSRAMWAMAKASYPLDKGIFDHLANHLASFLTKKDLPRVRLVSEALWACGKMIQWEDPLGEELFQFGKKSRAQPPYFYAAEKFVIFLSTNINEMSTKDISQSIWAAARLGLTPHVTNALFLAPIAQRASEVAPMFNSHELSNILWSLGKLGYNNTAILKALLDPLICSPDATCSPQEAANVMFALGKLQMREVEIFDRMMEVLKMNMNEVTPQAMYNSLWAHESVGLEPPRGFFDVWAQKRLGLPVDFRRKGQLTE